MNDEDTEVRCFFADDPDAGPCTGRLVRAHLCRQQTLRREGHRGACWDARSWVWMCGGLGYGNGAHHGAFDSGRLVIPREQLPQGFIDLMCELGMSYFIDKHYGSSRSSFEKSL